MTEQSNAPERKDKLKRPRTLSAPLSDGALRSLVRDRIISYDAYEAALRFLGVRPGLREWRLFWRDILSTCGALFLAAGIIFFFAWNWSGMHHFSKFALLGGVLTGSVLLALWRGLDSLPGRPAMLLASLSAGPLLAVYGQVYQSGADAWELFRVWAIVILPFALVGRQAALWLIFWVVGGIGWLLYADTLPWPGSYSLPGLPEFFIVQAIGVALWEAAFRRWGKTPEHNWLDAPWLPRIIVFTVGWALTMFLISLIFDSLIFDFRQSGHGYSWFLPERSTALCLYAASLAGGWHWYRHKRQDLFMLACGVFSLISLAVALLIRAETFSLSAGSLLVWGLFLAGLTAGGGHLLRRWRREMQQEQREYAASDSLMSQTAKAGLFDRFRTRVGWSELWEHLRALKLLPGNDTPPATPRESQPWYLSAMQAFGGWLSALFLIAFLGFFLYVTLDLGRDSKTPLLLGGLLFLGVARALLRRGGIFSEQFGIALALAGVSSVAAALIWLNRDASQSLLIVSLLLAVTYPLLPNATYRFLAAMSAPVLFLWGLDLLMAGWKDYNYFSLFWLRMGLQTICFTSLCLALAWGYLNERRWITTRNSLLAPLLNGVFSALSLALLCSVMLTRATFFLMGFGFTIPGRSIGLGAGIGLLYLAFHLTREIRSLPAAGAPRRLYPAFALLGLPLGWYLPGITVALFSLALSRYLGDRVKLGLACFTLFAYIFYYYYNLQTTLLHKSITLTLTGLLLLLASLALRRLPETGGPFNFPANSPAGDPATRGGRHA